MYLTFVFATSIVLNILVILVFNKRAGHVTHSNKFLLNLSICNLMSSLFIVPFAFVTLLLRGWIFGYVWCQMTGFFMNLVFTASTLTLVVIALDRYHAIVTPLHYPMLMTSKKCYRMLSLVWVVAIITMFNSL
ncbi:G-protein coupled receptor 161-like [Patella vulgata]|uniref:G-protein coupled receptor 161-like n=1 Tax=Patella vulgata TaxID=6465 RepID=UPI0024A93702|nr:G-protein coupled receptor 161-like [Patella vulgata]